MPATHLLTVDAPSDRLDRFAATRLPHLTRSHLKLLIDSGLVAVDGKPGKPSQRLRPGQTVTVTVPDPTLLALAPEDIPLHVAYEDADIIVVDKPAGLTVHPGPGLGQRHPRPLPRPCLHQGRHSPWHRAPAGQGHLRPHRHRQA